MADGHETQVKERCEQIRRQIDETDSSYDKEKLQERLAKLAGGVDPAKVTRSALQNAASITGMVLTTECIVADLPEKKEAAPAAPGGGMGGDFDY